MENPKEKILTDELSSWLAGWDQQAFADQKELTDYELPDGEVIDIKNWLITRHDVAIATCAYLAEEGVAHEEEFREEVYSQDDYAVQVAQHAAGIGMGLQRAISLDGSDWPADFIPVSTVARAMDKMIVECDKNLIEGQDG